jgi:hypothetical protein
MKKIIMMLVAVMFVAMGANAQTVYVSSNGQAVAYHKSKSCSYLQDSNVKAVSMSEAKKMGRHECTRCYGSAAAPAAKKPSVVKKDAKKVGDAVKKAEKATAKEVKKDAKKVEKGVEKAEKATAKEVKKDAKKVGDAVKKAEKATAKEVKKDAKKVEKGVKNAEKATAKEVKKDAKKVEKKVEKKDAKKADKKADKKPAAKKSTKKAA